MTASGRPSASTTGRLWVRYRLMLVRGGATLGPDRTVRRFDGVNEDITERRRAEQRLAEAQRLGQIGSFDRDLEADDVVWSPETYRIFGVDPEHLVPSREGVLGQVVAEDRGRLRDEVDAAIRDDGNFDCFVTIRRATANCATAAPSIAWPAPRAT